MNIIKNITYYIILSFVAPFFCLATEMEKNEKESFLSYISKRLTVQDKINLIGKLHNIGLPSENEAKSTIGSIMQHSNAEQLMKVFMGYKTQNLGASKSPKVNNKPTEAKKKKDPIKHKEKTDNELNSSKIDCGNTVNARNIQASNNGGLLLIIGGKQVDPSNVSNISQ